MAIEPQNPKLTKTQRDVLFEKATEAPFTGKFLHNKVTGKYVCANCGVELFDSKDKFDSKTPGLEGWPSFSDVIDKGAVKLVEDKSFGMHRVEVTCAKCGGHLGHVFGSAADSPNGMHFCVNSSALDFRPKNKK